MEFKTFSHPLTVGSDGAKLLIHCMKILKQIHEEEQISVGLLPAHTSKSGPLMSVSMLPLLLSVEGNRWLNCSSHIRNL